MGRVKKVTLTHNMSFLNIHLVSVFADDMLPFFLAVDYFSILWVLLSDLYKI